MLILAGVSIAAITGQEGFFSKVSSITKEYKKQSLIEAVNSAKLQLQLDHAIDKNIEINMSNLIDKLKEISEINEKDYIISDIEMNPETGAETITIVDKKTGVVLDITMETNGKVTIETSIVDDISKVTRPVIELTLEPEEGTYAETVIIKVKITEEENGIAKIQIPDENLTVNTYNNEKQVTFDFPVTENGTYTFIAENANGRKTTKTIEVKNTMSVRDITIENLGGEVTKSPTNIKISYDANPRIGGQVLTNTDKYQYIIGTESETNTWKTATTTIEEETGLAVVTIPVNENGEIHARYFDGTTGHKTKTFSIDNIDDEKPKIIEATASTSWGQTNSITLKATDAGSTNCATGNYGIIGYGINQSTETEPTYTEFNATTSLSTEIKNITANGTYVVWVKDKAGNTAKTQVTVNRVDTLAPTTATLAVVENSITTTTFTLKATGAEATATNTSGASGIAKYEFHIKNSDGTFKLEKTIESTNTTENYEVSGKAAGTSYTYKVIVYDAVGKSKTSSEVTVTTIAAVPTYTINTGNNQTYDGKTTGTYNNPIIPKGFAPINENGAVWGSEDGYQKGLVITDEITNGVSTGNEFVWVPVDGTNVKFERIESSGSGNNAKSKSQCTVTISTELSQSITNNQGFYIARFELGVGVISKQGAIVWRGASLTDYVNGINSKYASSNSNYGVTSMLVNGTQWDTALSFIMAYGGDELYPNFLANSTGFGNYNSGDSVTSLSAPATCGASPEFRQKNIYDMAGNMFEWTDEQHSSHNIARGGRYNNDGSVWPVSSRLYPSPSYNGNEYTSRMALYIK